MGKASTAGVLRLRATSAMTHDKSPRRSAQDDDFVGVSTKNTLNKLALYGTRKPLLAIFTRPHCETALRWRVTAAALSGANHANVVVSELGVRLRRLILRHMAGGAIVRSHLTYMDRRWV